ncbi:MAG: hypothetical protein GF317_13690 [Candidatus Lokiarchaeota archaeon]|nr:hypothetical protein [Candidatus Lokiarchaeota archaeon]MBD3200686.1 hypothetical protein [Candidatus Lokiarchaeota archaeon]
MKIKKVKFRPSKIEIDLILCPKTNLYLQNLYCRHCGYYDSENDNFIICKYKNVNFTQKKRNKEKAKSTLINEFYRKENNETSRTPPNQVQQNTPQNNFANTLNQKQRTPKPDTGNTVMEELKSKFKKDSLVNNLEKVN